VVRDFRQAHRIVPVEAPAEDPVGGHLCEWDGIRVYQIKGGWRHNMAEVRVLIERAPIPQPGDYR
jgi:hypothetical protein